LLAEKPLVAGLPGAADCVARSWSTLRAAGPMLPAFRGLLASPSCELRICGAPAHFARRPIAVLAAPLLMTALSVRSTAKSERPALARDLPAAWAGVLADPSALGGNGAFSMAAAAAAALATVCYSLSALTVRSLGRRNTSMAMVFCIWDWWASDRACWRSATGGPVANPSDWLWRAAIGVSGALGQLWLTEAFRRAPPSVVGPLNTPRSCGPSA